MDTDAVDGLVRHESPPLHLLSPRARSPSPGIRAPLPLACVLSRRVDDVFAHDSEFRSLASQVVQRADARNVRYIEQALTYLELARDAASKAVHH